MKTVEAPFGSLIEHAPVAIGISRDGVILHANSAYLKIFGFERLDETIGEPIADHWSSEWRELIYEHTSKSLQGLAVPTECEAIALRKDGSPFPVQVVVTTIELADGQATVEFITDLTERKRAEEALWKRNRYVETILEESPIGFAVHTVDDGVVRFVSARFEEIYGIPRGTIDTFDTFFDKVWPHNHDFRMQIRSRVVADMESGDASRMRWEDIPVWSASGEIRYITAMNIPVLDQNLMVSTVRDVTAQVRAQEALRKSEERFRGIFEGSIEGIYQTSIEGKLLLANPAMAGILGYASPEDAIQSITDASRQVWAIPEERSRLIQRIEKEGMVQQYECQFKCKDGTLVWVSLKTKAVRGPDGGIAYLEGFIENIDERRRALEILESRERFLAEVAKIGNVGGWEFNIDTGKQKWTDETYNIHEVDPTYEPTVGKGVAFFTPDSRPIIEQAMQQAIEHGTPYDLELEIITARGNRRDIRTIGRADLANRRVFGFFQDISQRKQNEREMAALRHDLSHLSRVLTLNEVSATLAHEVNQPLGAILNNAEAARMLLPRAQDQQGELPEILNDIIQEARRAGDVIRRVRTLVKKGDMPFELLHLNGLIHDVLGLVRSTIAINRITLQLDLKPDLASIRGDRVRLQQVLLNLVMNALDAMKGTPSGTLTVCSAMDGSDMVTVSVGDTGPGLDKAARAMLFQPFFTTKRDGLGLGLSICQSIIDEHGGRIWGDSNPGEGATFSFSLKAWNKESV